MSLPNARFYGFTNHATERYKERFGGEKSYSQILQDFRKWAQDMTYVSTSSHNGCETWVSQESGVLAVVDPVNFSVVTLNPVPESRIVELTSKEDGSTLRRVREIVHPKVAGLLEEFATQALRSQENEYGEHLGRLYMEYGERMYKLSRTKRTDLYDKGKEELANLKAIIDDLEDECDEVMSNLNRFMPPKREVIQEEYEVEFEEVK